MSTLKLTPLWLRILRVWLPIAVAVTALVLLADVAVQQNYRMSANDPQIQMAQDAAAVIFSGATPDSVIPSVTVDAGTSLAPFIVVYDHNGVPVAGNGQIGGALLAPPLGVLTASQDANDGNAVTWQPSSGVRIASVTFAADQAKRSQNATGGLFYVLAGRNLREVEIREANNDRIAEIVLLATLLATLVVVVVIELIAGSVVRRDTAARKSRS